MKKGEDLDPTGLLSSRGRPGTEFIALCILSPLMQTDLRAKPSGLGAMADSSPFGAGATVTLVSAAGSR